ncbi:MAG: glycogen-binding domain-containing protein [Acidobacteriota bacterium]|nr:glycogen-binding domain-containing protein [Acidobacteriota bacterium]
MSIRAVHAFVLATTLVTVGLPTEARGQTWSVDLSAGQIVYNPASVDIGTDSLVGSLRYDTRREGWVYGTVAAPLGSDAPFWGGLGAGGRLTPSGSEDRHATFGVELNAHGFTFRDAVVDQIGTGGILEAIPFASLSAGAGRVEVRGGWRGQALSFAGATQNRGVFETGARAMYGSTVRLQADARWVHAPEGTYPFVGGSLQYGGGPISVWARAGKWVSTELAAVAWGGGVGVAIGSRASVWTTVQQEAPDPLYWNAPRRSWSVGVTQRIGRTHVAIVPAPRSDADGVVIRVAVSETPTGDLQIAGSFNNWQSVPMQREGREWIIRLPLAAGVYHYAFRSGNGEWFVPASAAGRRDDGMGGQVAVLVVL